MDNKQIISKINNLKKENNVIILAHNYQIPEVQDVADFLGDSLDLAKKATKTNADVIVFCGVDFMAESAKILNPDKTVILPDISAECPMAGMVDPVKLVKLKNDNPEAKIICHPECQKPVQIVSEFIGSTSALLNFVTRDPGQSYIVATESGILHQMRKANPEKTFIPAPPADSTCACNDCKYMRLHTLEKLYNCLKYEQPEILMDEDLMKKAEKPIRRMLLA